MIYVKKKKKKKKKYCTTHEVLTDDFHRCMLYMCVCMFVGTEQYTPTFAKA